MGIYVEEEELHDEELDAGGCGGDGHDAVEGAAVQTGTSDDSGDLWSCRSLAQSADEQEGRLGRGDVLGGGDDVSDADAVVDENTVFLAKGYIGPGPGPGVNTTVSCSDLQKYAVELVVG